MNIIRPSRTNLSCLLFAMTSSAFYLLPSAFGQGALTPSGPPFPTMKSLDQVEPRIPIPGGNSGFFIFQPGSYYLTGDIIITNDVSTGIAIDASNVVLDLEGYSIVCTKSLTQNATGIGDNFVSPPSNLTIRNGRIMGFNFGVVSTMNNTTIENLTLSDIRMWGINIGGPGTNRFVANIRDNTIVNVDLNQSGMPNNRAAGILLQGVSGVVEHNSIMGVFGLTGSPSLYGEGMELAVPANGYLEVVNNRVANANTGITFFSGPIVYRDNIVMACTNHYSGSATNLGNNF